MNSQNYFDEEHYNGNHLHVDNYQEESNLLIEGIAWVRQNGSMDLFFNGFADAREKQELFIENKRYCETFKGGYIGNVKTDEQAYSMFHHWTAAVLNPYRNQTKSLPRRR
ncbi:hypothetical protein [Alkalicoccus daliensis]|uniref:Uncharacterized protein n=1 Tax=Alkalicoccus daliensis TaxID=745820 RepID=A0A1H0ERI2_9BACI|nr:hypothetical protein [Alkalicoccus daliensis]SDN84913.1 hypothetical protein SAMN04488053_10431 [Alkalicoccus daliensis]